MILTETAPPAETPVSVSELAEHLRLGTGFADPPPEAGLLALYLAAATRHIEARLGVALVARPFALRVGAWDRRGHLALPVGPVAAIDSFAFLGEGGPVALSTADLEVAPGTTRQRLSRLGGVPLPPVPPGMAAELGFTAGHGTAAEVPPDLRQAVAVLAAHFYDTRTGSEPDAPASLPPAVLALVAPHRPVRL